MSTSRTRPDSHTRFHHLSRTWQRANARRLAVVIIVCLGSAGPEKLATLASEENEPASNSGDDQSGDRRADPDPYVLTTYRQSYFKLDSSGAHEKQDGHLIRAEKTFRLSRTIHPEKTAVIVMDPWIDMDSDQLNDYFGAITESHVNPLVHEALDRGHPVIVLTNDPEIVDFNTKIHPTLAALVEDGKAEMLYHQDLDYDLFAERLRSRSINSLIYVGFASNMCVIGRRMGMIPMVQQGFRNYFVPQASAAIEYPDTWESQAVHHATTRMIAQWIAEIVDYEVFMNATSDSAPASAP